MKRQTEISQHCWKFIYINIPMQVYLLHVTDFILYNFFFYLHRNGENIYTNKSSSSGIYWYFNGSVRRVNKNYMVEKRTEVGTEMHVIN